MKARKTWIAKCPCCDSEFICTHKRGSIKKYCSRKCKKRSSKKRYYKKYREREILKAHVKVKRKSFIKNFIKELIKKYSVKKIKIRGHCKSVKIRIKRITNSTFFPDSFCKVCDQKYMFGSSKVYCSENCEKAWSNTTKGGRGRSNNRNTVKWLTFEQKKQIAQMYAFRPRNHDVDHIVPSKGENVSGLHVPWNLRWLRHKDNSKKGVNF